MIENLFNLAFGLITAFALVAILIAVVSSEWFSDFCEDFGPKYLHDGHITRRQAKKLASEYGLWYEVKWSKKRLGSWENALDDWDII